MFARRANFSRKQFGREVAICKAWLVRFSVSHLSRKYRIIAAVRDRSAKLRRRTEVSFSIGMCFVVALSHQHAGMTRREDVLVNKFQSLRV